MFQIGDKVKFKSPMTGIRSLDVTEVYTVTDTTYRDIFGTLHLYVQLNNMFDYYDHNRFRIYRPTNSERIKERKRII